MIKISKKILSLFLSLIMIMSMFTGLEVSSVAEDDILSYLTYEIKDGEVTITSCDTEISGDVVIPNTIEGYPVTKIGNSAFEDCDSITEILIPDSIITIGNSAFYSCDKITNIVIPDSVTTIDNHAFYWCKELNNVKLGNSVTTIGAYSFNSCDNFTDIIIPDSVISIGENAFNLGFLSSYQRFVIYGTPGSAAENYAKANYENNRITFVDITTFSGDPSTNDGLAYINWLINDDEVSIIFLDKSFSGNIIIPSKINGYPVTAISISAFSECNLTGISLPDSLKKIENNAFEKCKKLTTITIPDSVNSIGTSTFKNCPNLTSAIIGNGVTFIESHAFYYCNNLTNIIISNSANVIDNGAFAECYKLESISIPDGVTIIADHAFEYSGLTSVIIPDSVTTIGNYAFEGCEDLTSVTIPDSVTTIGNYAFGYSWMGIKIEGFTIYGTPGTAAETYANENGITFIAVGSDEPTTEEPTTEEPTTEEPITVEPTTKEPTTKEPETEVPTTEPTTKEPETQAPTTEKPTEKPTQKPISDKLEVSNKNITVDEKAKTVTFGQKNTAEDISKAVKNNKSAIFGKDGKELGKSDLVGTGAEIRIMDNSGKILSRYTVCVPTDVDGNGKTTAADARLALRGSAKLEKIEGVYAQASDVTGDGKITAADARKILRISAGLEKA